MSKRKLGFEMDEAMKFLYREMQGINPDECVVLDEKVGEYMIQVGGENARANLREFLKGKMKTVVIDHCSSREMNEEAIVKSMMNPVQAELCGKLYIEWGVLWGVIGYEGRNVGVAKRVEVYNGLPRFVTNEEIERDPRASIEKAYKLLESASLLTLLSEPSKLIRTDTGLHKDFLETNPVYDMEGRRI